MYHIPVQSLPTLKTGRSHLGPACFGVLDVSLLLPKAEVRDDGSWMRPDSITAWLNRFSAQNDLPHIHPHAFRHTAASTMIANGVDLVTTAAELGHANANTTATIYAHQIAIARATAADVRAGVFAGRK